MSQQRLDDRLWHILDHFSEGSRAVYNNPEMWSEWVEDARLKIKQVFTDEGYALHSTAQITTSELMTGQEWYDKFTDYIHDIPTVDWGPPTEQSEKDWGKNHAALYVPQEAAVEAAKRASGL